MIHIEQVSKTFASRGGAVLAVDRVDLDVEPGGFVAIVGPSGCGKTTLLRMMAGLETLSDGRILVDGDAVVGPSPKLGVVFQRPVLLEWRTILQNLLLPIELRRRPNDADRENAKRLLAMVGLTDFADRYPRELSGGMQQRASICRALIADPEVILLDEPFGALDALTREHLHLEFNELWRSTGKTVVMITHDIPEAVFLAERVVVMGPRPGRIIETFDVPFGPERDERVQADPRFGQLVLRIRESLEAKETTR
ncbi:ABC transporter ATP-binding protein [Leucobacter rhizosphaerae]|uniref:ABC transporter ATP-binding protein n=1 Tax=Leucobacter rhizosphaerae TaxID=2932245 RepID=A0ABY4FTH7_9MICO|nr:ABC transporter ATP-binding protein [Leucobacter rhizosphaerae]UOQ59557.1 ABC transporter ATP-binding protein [Leucobacter rhizosphaerae]